MRTNIKKYRNAKKHIEDDKHQDLVFNYDVLTEILQRLPIRSLIRSKCVSKHWRSLISDHRFVSLRNPNPNPPRGLFLQRIDDVDANTPEYDFVPFDREQYAKPPFKTLNFNLDVSDSGIIVLHSSNGLMLCYSLHEKFCKVSNAFEYNVTYYVFNPTTNQAVILPKPKLQGCDWVQRWPLGMTLAFDPLKSPHYKVICVEGHLLGDPHYMIEIYSSETRSWKMFEQPLYNHLDTEFIGGVYWNNAVHWINKIGYILYLKVNEDVLDTIPTPTTREICCVKKHCYPLVESRDRLLFIELLPSFGMKFDIHEMNRDYSGWSLKYQIDRTEGSANYECLNDANSLGLSYFMPSIIRCLVIGEREEDSFIVLEVPGKAIRYNIVLKTYQVLCDLKSSRPSRMPLANDGFPKLGRWPGAFLFFESLSHV